MPGDCDGSGNVGLNNYAGFQTCLTGPSTGVVAPECFCADLDNDGDVDVVDFGLFQLIFTG